MTTNVLVVDDNQDYRETLALMLESMGYAVETASNGMEALEIIQRKAVSVLLTDFVMPGKVRSIDVAHTLKKMSPRSLVIFISGYQIFDKDVLGVAETMQKPVEAGEVDRVIRNHLDTMTYRGI